MCPVQVLTTVKDPHLQHTLRFGIGLHHAGLNERDRQLSEQLFCEQKIQLLVATSTLAWGVNTPAHLVVIKGTEFFDGKTKRCAPLQPLLCMLCMLPLSRALPQQQNDCAEGSMDTTHVV